MNAVVSSALFFLESTIEVVSLDLYFVESRAIELIHWLLNFLNLLYPLFNKRNGVAPIESENLE